MKKDIMRKWVRALRSGKYRQTTGVLCNAETGGLCCLGVLTELYQKETGKTWNKKLGGPVVQAKVFNREWGSPPSAVLKWAGMKNGGILTESVMDCVDLAALNDTAMITFPEIADVIEEQYEDL